MSLISLTEAARTEQEVFFFLSEDAANEHTLEGEKNFVYSAHFCFNFDDSITYNTYPYAYLGQKSGKAQWQMVGRPWCDFEKLRIYTTLEEAIGEMFPGN